MRTSLLAAVSVAALLATPALAGDAPKSATAGPDVRQFMEQSVSPREAAKMVGKQVVFAGSQQVVGQIVDVVERDGRVTDVVVRLQGKEARPGLVSLDRLSPAGDRYVTTMTEEELAAARGQEAGAASAAGGAGIAGSPASGIAAESTAGTPVTPSQAAQPPRADAAAQAPAPRRNLHCRAAASSLPRRARLRSTMSYGPRAIPKSASSSARATCTKFRPRRTAGSSPF